MFHVEQPGSDLRPAPVVSRETCCGRPLSARPASRHGTRATSKPGLPGSEAPARKRPPAVPASPGPTLPTVPASASRAARRPGQSLPSVDDVRGSRPPSRASSPGTPGLTVGARPPEPSGSPDRELHDSSSNRVDPQVSDDGVSSTRPSLKRCPRSAAPPRPTPAPARSERLRLRSARPWRAPPHPSRVGMSGRKPTPPRWNIDSAATRRAPLSADPFGAARPQPTSAPRPRSWSRQALDGAAPASASLAGRGPPADWVARLPTRGPTDPCPAPIGSLTPRWRNAALRWIPRQGACGAGVPSSRSVASVAPSARMGHDPDTRGAHRVGPITAQSTQATAIGGPQRLCLSLLPAVVGIGGAEVRSSGPAIRGPPDGRLLAAAPAEPPASLPPSARTPAPPGGRRDRPGRGEIERGLPLVPPDSFVSAAGPAAGRNRRNFDPRALGSLPRRGSPRRPSVAARVAHPSATSVQAPSAASSGASGRPASSGERGGPTTGTGASHAGGLEGREGGPCGLPGRGAPAPRLVGRGPGRWDRPGAVGASRERRERRTRGDQIGGAAPVVDGSRVALAGGVSQRRPATADLPRSVRGRSGEQVERAGERNRWRPARRWSPAHERSGATGAGGGVLGRQRGW